jgi:hypothetical protein
VFKRVIWMGMGATAGAGATMWANRKVKRTVAKLAPEALTDELTARARSFGRDLVDAVAEGREAMRAREAELQQRLPPALRPPAGRPAFDRTSLDPPATGRPDADPSSPRRGTRRNPIDVNGTELAPAPARRALPPAADRRTRRSRRSGRR